MAAWSATPCIVRWLTSHITTSTARPQNPARVASAIAVMIALTPRRSVAIRRVNAAKNEAVYNIRDIGVPSHDTVAARFSRRFIDDLLTRRPAPDLKHIRPKSAAEVQPRGAGGPQEPGCETEASLRRTIVSRPASRGAVAAILRSGKSLLISLSTM